MSTKRSLDGRCATSRAGIGTTRPVLLHPSLWARTQISPFDSRTASLLIRSTSTVSAAKALESAKSTRIAGKIRRFIGFPLRFGLLICAGKFPSLPIVMHVVKAGLFEYASCFPPDQKSLNSGERGGWR
ncbi:MAG: hypothetical protein WCW66_02655 [Patescibacteria group bacterium]